MNLVKDGTNINFLGSRKFYIVLSSLLILVTFVLLLTKGLNYGIDFSGGTLVQIQTQKVTKVGEIRGALSEVKGISIQEFDGSDNEYLIRVPNKEKQTSQQISSLVKSSINNSAIGNVDIRRVEFVGPQIGDELKKKGFLAIVLSMLAILVYISIRFEMRYAIGALMALLHDIILTVGIFSLLQKEMTLPVLAALLTIIGYSLNDTIVVFDRVRENRRKFKKIPIIEVLNKSINEMMNRTLMTSLTTLAVLLALFFLGGGVIHDFAFTLMFGVIVGTYSSVFVASPVVLMMESYYRKLADAERTMYRKEQEFKDDIKKVIKKDKKKDK